MAPAQNSSEGFINDHRVRKSRYSYPESGSKRRESDSAPHGREKGRNQRKGDKKLGGR